MILRCAPSVAVQGEVRQGLLLKIVCILGTSSRYVLLVVLGAGPSAVLGLSPLSAALGHVVWLHEFLV